MCRVPFRVRLTFPFLLLLAAAPYACFLWAPFHLDDRAHVIESAGLANLRTAWPGSWKAYFGRGVTGFAFALERQAWGTDPTLYRAANVLLHAACGWLLYGLLRRLAVSARLAAGRPIAAAATLLFLLHPLQTGSVAYISGRHGLLSALFILGALVAFWDLRRRGRGALRFALFSFLAFGSKEEAVVLPALMGLVALVSRGPGPRLRGAGSGFRGTAVSWLWAFGLVFFFLAARFGWAWREPSAARAQGWVVTEAERMYDRWTYLRTQCAVVPWDYGAKWLLPAGLSIDLDPAPRWRWDGASAAGGALLLAAAGLSFAGLLRGRLWGALGLWVLVALVPSSSVQPLEELAAERRTYLASAGLAALSGWGVALLARGAGRRSGVAVGILLGALGLVSAARGADYRGVESLWKGAVLESPRKGRPYLAMGTGCEARRKEPRAALFYQAALRAQPEDGRAAYMLGGLAWRAGDLARAEAWFGKALATKPGHLPFALAWADSALARRDWPAAAERLAAALAAGPDDPGIRARLGFARARAAEGAAELRARAEAAPQDRAAARDLAAYLRRTGELDGAVAAWEDLAASDPSDAGAWNGLADALFARGGEEDLARAVEAIDRSIVLSPDDPFLHAFRGQALAAAGRWGEAAGAYRRAVALKESEASWWTALGRALSEAGRPAEAVDAWTRALRQDPGDLEARNGLARGGAPAPRGARR